RKLAYGGQPAQHFFQRSEFRLNLFAQLVNRIRRNQLRRGFKMPIPQPRGNRQRAFAVALPGGSGGGQKLVRHLGHGAHHHDRRKALVAAALHNAGGAIDGNSIFDGGPAELHHNELVHAGTATGSSFPSETSNSAFSSAAPAAPRIVLCESTVNFQSSSPQGRSRPTVAAMPLPRILSSRGCGRSSWPANSTGCAGAIGKSRPASGVNSRHACRISSRVAFRESLILTLSVCPSSTETRLQCALIFAPSGFTTLPSREPSRRSVSACIFSSSFL